MASDELLKQLPDPKGTLNKTVPLSAIKMANNEVSNSLAWLDHFLGAGCYRLPCT